MPTSELLWPGMARTYLALATENQASDSDRAIVLGALFRPTEDGIVKDMPSRNSRLQSYCPRQAHEIVELPRTTDPAHAAALRPTIRAD